MIKRAVLATVMVACASAAAQTTHLPGSGEERPWAAGVPAAQQARALELFKQGNALFEESHHAEALARYREAIQSWDHPGIRFNLAVSLIHLDQPRQAYENLAAALRYGAAPLGAELYAQALTYQKLLRGQLAELKVVCAERDAAVSLDGEALFRGPGEATRLVLPGAHQLVAEKRGFLTDSRAVLLLPGRQTVETVRPLPLGALTRTRRRWPAWKPWVVFAAGLVVALVGVPLELQAKSDYDSYDQEIARSCATGCAAAALPQPVRALKSKAANENGAALGAFAVGGAVAVSGVVLLIVNQPRVELPPRVTLAPWVGDGRGGLVLGGTF